MHDLKKVEEKFHEFLSENLDEDQFRIDEIRITKKLLKKQEAFYIPFGHVSYFLVIEGEKPVLFVNISSRMDLNLIVFVDEDGCKEYDVWGGDHKDISEKYQSQSKKVKGYDDLKFISDVEEERW